MATSESDDFESADEELSHGVPAKRGTQQWSSPTTIGSESDDDTEFVPRTPYVNSMYSEKPKRVRSPTTATAGNRTSGKDTASSKGDKDTRFKSAHGIVPYPQKAESLQAEMLAANIKCVEDENAELKGSDENKVEVVPDKVDPTVCSTASKNHPKEKRRPNQRRSDRSQPVGGKKLGAKIIQNSYVKPSTDTATADNLGESLSEALEKLSVTTPLNKICSNMDSITSERKLSQLEKDTDPTDLSKANEITEVDMPEEMKSNKKFKEVFEPEGWEGIGDEIELPDDLTEEKLQPILEKISSVGQGQDNATGNWSGWGSWGVSSLINTATAGVSTISSHVSHGLTLLEESMAIPEPTESLDVKETEEPVNDDNKLDIKEESQLYSSFGFGNLISGVSSITKLVESTSNRVMSGGLDTLEAIGKKTMEVLQDGDPGLKKKRAFFLNEGDKPILSQALREAKEKAEAAEKTIEEKQNARKVHFESLFDDYQGLVHLEALEMLSKQCNIKIQQHLAGLDTKELNSIQETLEEVKELCELSDEDENSEDPNEKDLKVRLQEASNDLGINITYEKLSVVWEESLSYLTPPVTHAEQEIFQHAISALAQFTALSVERFHKTAELLLIKERRSTVNEADALVQLTYILSNQIGTLANSFCSVLNELVKTSEKSDNVTTNITTVFMEASNASSYIQDAFRLLIPILQVGAI